MSERYVRRISIWSRECRETTVIVKKDAKLKREQQAESS